MIVCPQCKAEIDGIHPKTYSTGWCRLDIHLACLPLHVRSCQACRHHNEAYISKNATAQPPHGAKM